jgi:hypothetical protein
MFSVVQQLSFIETNVVWLSCAVLEAAILFRGWKAGLLRRHSFFYAYIAWILLAEALRFWCYKQTPNFYLAVYWDTQLVTDAVSYAVCFEIFKNALWNSRGVARAAQKLSLIVFVFALSYALSDLFHGRLVAMPHVAAVLDCYLSYVEAALLLVLLWLFGRYRISFGRNLLGLIAAYSLWVGFDVIILTLLYLPGKGASTELRRLGPIVFLTALIIWCVSLWRSQPEPSQPPESALERDYELLQARTKAAFAYMSARALRTFRP